MRQAGPERECLHGDGRHRSAGFIGSATIRQLIGQSDATGVHLDTFTHVANC